MRRHFSGIYNKQVLANIVRVDSLNINWCLVPKVASSSISRVLLPHLPPQSGDLQPSQFIQKEVWARAGHLTSLTSLPPSPTFLITRHPLARVASAWSNKLRDRSNSHDGEYFYNTYSRQIIKFSRGFWRPEDPEPTFPEFIHFLINTDIEKYDEHWQPVALRCRLCQTNVTHVLHYESLETEWPQLLEDLGLGDRGMELPWENKGQVNSGNLRQLYDIISEAELVQLHHKFSADFQMFGYQMDDDF